MPILTCRRVRFYAQGDELAFFTWLGNIKAVRKMVGSGGSLFLHVPQRISDKGLRELLAVFFRYHIDMTQLAQFESKSNRTWFVDPIRYWHKRVFRQAVR